MKKPHGDPATTKTSSTSTTSSTRLATRAEERIGDHCVNVSKSVLELAAEPPFHANVDLATLGALVQGLLQDALTALRTEDVQVAARAVVGNRRAVNSVRRLPPAS